MGFDRKDRIQFEVRKELKELIEIKVPFSQGQMFIRLFVIIVEVDLCHVFTERFDPQGKRGFAEDVMMTRIETESKIG